MKQTWQLLLENSNHYKMQPTILLTSSSYELVDYMMDSLNRAFKDMGYKSFQLTLKCVESGTIVRDWTST